VSNFGSGFGLAPALQQPQEPIPFAPSGAGLAPALRGEFGTDADRERRLMDTFRESYNTDPNFAAEAQKYADELGASRATVAANMDVAKRMAVARSLRYQELKGKFPTLLDKFSNVKFASVAHDDVGNLKATESTWEWLGRQGEAGMAANQRGYLGVRRALGWMTPDEQVELDRLNVSMREAGQDSGIAAATAQTLGQMAGTVPLAMGVGAAAAGFASLGGPVSAGAAFTGASTAAGFSLSAMIEGGNAYEDMLAQGIDKETAAKAAFGVVAPVNGALEMVGMHYFAAPFKSAFSKLAVRKVSSKLVAETAGSAFNRFALSYAKSYLSEIGTEVLQEAVSMSAGGVARSASRPDLPAMTWADIMGQLGEIAGKTAQGMLLPALPGPAFQFVGDSITARQSLVEQQFLKDAIQQQGESKVAKRAPNARLEFLAATARGSDGATTYVRTETALNALRQDGLTIEDLAAKSPEIAAKLNEAREKGLESAAFPTATYIGKLQGTTFGDTLLPHLRLSEASMSLEELRQFAKDEPKRTAEAAALIEAYKATSKEWADSSATVREGYRTSILQAGRSDQEATTVASFLTAFAETQAYGLGITPSEFVARFPLRIMAGDTGAAATQRLGQDGPVLLRSKADKRDDETVVAESAVDRLGIGPEDLADVGVGESLGSEANRVVGVPSLAGVIAKMRAAAAVEPQVLDAIVDAVPVDVVNRLFGSKGAAKMALHDQAMLQDSSAFDADLPVAIGGDAADPVRLLVREAARVAAEVVRSRVPVEARLKTPELGAALGAGDGNRFRQGDDSKPKAVYQPSDLTIVLGSKADASSLLHELGHFYLHVLGQLALAPDATRAAADFQTFATWAGVKDAATWNAMTLEEQRPHHEAFARSFEIFLHEGVAPSAELRTLFERFRSWLVSVYRDIVGQLNANYRKEFGRDLPALTPEVRGMMGRLVAADEAIAKAEAVRDMRPLFQTLEESGMTAEEFAAYEQSIAEAHEASVTDLGKASLRQMQWLTGARSRLTKQLQSKNEKLRREAEREVGLRISGEPIYRAIRWLRKGELLNEDGTKAQGDRDPNHLLNRDAVEAMFPGADLTKLDGMTIKTGGISPDLAAEALGFTGGGEAMLKAILEAPTLAERIETDADALMLERHGDMATPEAREAAVEEALHNEARMRFVATELRWLSKSTEPVRIMVQAAQEAAREAIAALPVRQLTPRTFALAEARSARLSAKEAKAGNMVEAVRAKRQQLLHSQMAAEALRARREVDTAKADWRKFFRPDIKLSKTRNVDFVNAGRAVLAWYGLGPKGDKPPGAYVQALKDYNPTLYAEIEPTLARVVDTPRDFRDLTTEEFRALVVTVDALWDASKRSRQITVEGKKLELAAVTGEVLARLNEIGVPTVLPGETADVTKGQRAIRGIHQIGAALKRVEHWADTLDGGKSGPFTRYVWRPVQDAINAYRQQRNKVVKDYVELLGTIEWTQGKIDAPELGYTFGTDNGGGGMETLLGAMLHTGNESNLRKLLLGRGWGDVDAEGALVTSRWDAFLARMVAEGRLDKRHFDWVQKVWDLTESLKPEAQKAWHDINGFYFKEVEASARTQTFKDGSTATYRGGYVPAKVDGFMVRDADVHQKLAELEADFRNSQPSVATGFGKSRVEGYTKPLSLDVRKIAAHLDSVVRFIHVQPAIRSVLKVVNDRAVSATLSRVDSTAVNDLILPWLNRAAQQQTMEGDPSSLVNRFWNAVRKRTGMSAMFANLSNALQQVTGYFPAALKVAPRYLKGGLAAYAKDFKGVTADVAARSEWMAHRLENQTFEIADAMNDLLINPTKFDKVRKWSDRHAYFLQSAFQNQVDVVTWLGAYNQSMEQQGAKVADAAAEREAVQKADAAVRMTQGSRDPESLARFEASTPFVKLFTQFSGYFNMLANLNASEYRKLFRELGWGAFGRKGAGRLGMLYVLGFGAPTLIADAIAKSLGGKWDDEEDDGYSDDLAQWFFAANAKGLVGMLPGVGPAINAVVRGVSSSSPYDDRMSMAPSITALESATFGVAKTAENVAQGKLSGRNVRDVLTLLTLLTGVPVSALGKPIGYAMDADAGKFEPTGPVDYGRGLLTGMASEASKR